jgi:hypothetical protein
MESVARGIHHKGRRNTLVIEARRGLIGEHGEEFLVDFMVYLTMLSIAHIASYGKIMNECRIEKEVEGNFRGLTWSTALALGRKH